MVENTQNKASIVDNGNIRLAAARVLSLESNGLLTLADGLDENFDAAVNLLGQIKGKLVVVSGQSFLIFWRE